MEQTLSVCCELYNWCLTDRRDCWEFGGHSVNKYDQMKRVREFRGLDIRFAMVNHNVLEDAVKRLDKAYSNFFRRIKKGEKSGYPRYKPPQRYDSFTYTKYADGCKMRGKRLYLQHIGEIKIKLHRPIEGDIRTVTIKRQADGWYACFACEVEPKILPASGESVGIDLGLEFFVTTSDGETFPCPKYMKKAEKNIKRLQRQKDRRKKGSNRRKKAVQQLAKAHLHIADQRKDNAHKVARSLVNRYGVIAVEDLSVLNMVKNHYLAGAILDAGWCTFIRILSSKAEEAGRQVIKVDPRNTSQICSQCGVMVKKPLSQRQHICPECGLSIHRDVNAAINVLHRAA